jgi:rod shape-determining protein MreC
MAWMQIKVRILGNNTSRSGSLSRRMLFIWCLLASIIFYLVPQNYSNKLQFAFAHVFSFPLSMESNVSLSASTQQRIGDTIPKKQYEALYNDYLNLQEQLRKQKEQFKSLDRLNNSVIEENIAFIMGHIIPAAAERQYSELIINCGTTTGLEQGQFVLARNNSILGKITDISPQLGKAKVRLITDPDSKIGAKLEGLNQNLQMQGNGDGTAKIGMVRRENKIKVGQKVFALEQPGFLDSPKIVGTVSKCKTDDKAPWLWEITVTPAWELEELNEVAIIVMNPPGSKKSN